MKEIIGVGFNIPSNEEDYIPLNSYQSLSDTDIVVFSPNFELLKSFYSTEKYEGRILYSKESSANILDYSKHWKKEMVHFISNGGTAFCILPEKKDFFIYSGTKEVSGTGRNQKTIYHVKPFSNYNFLPLELDIFHTANGKSIVCQNSLFSDFYKNFNDLISYKVYLKPFENDQIIFTTKNSDRILGVSKKIEKGFLIFLPYFDFDDDIFFDFNDHEWEEEAIKRGKNLKNIFASIDKSLRAEKEETPKPVWLESKQYELKESLNIKKFISKIENELIKKQNELEGLKEVLKENDSLKDLLFETGKALELAVIKSLRILGYRAENYNDGELELDQIIESPEGARFIGECEGKDNKDIDVSKFRQLLDGLNADFEKENVQEKAFGLLFGNPQRLLEPHKRKLNFTNKCKSGAKREKIGLILTSDLFKICKLILENNDQEYARECRLAILNQLGDIINFPSYTKRGD